MSLYRNRMQHDQKLTTPRAVIFTRGRSRRWLLSSAAGAMLWVPTASLSAADIFSPRPVARVEATEPGRLLLPAHGVREIAPVSPIQLTSGEGQPQPKSDVQRGLEELYRRDGRPVPEMTVPQYTPPVQTTGGARRAPERPPSLMDRLFGSFRKDKPGTHPPVDPGMNYPTASQPPQQQQLRTQQPRSFVPPAVPGVTSQGVSPAPAAQTDDASQRPVAVPGTPQPGLFQPPASANPIGQPLVTPAPNNGELNAEFDGPKINPAPPSGNAPHPLAAQPEQPLGPGRSPLPVFDFNAPVQPAQPPVAEITSVPPTPANEPVSVNNGKPDPFANIFPEEPEEMEDEEFEKPYTGLTLEEDLFLGADTQPQPAPQSANSVPPIAEDQPVVSDSGSPQQFLPPVVDAPTPPPEFEQPRITGQPETPPAMLPDPGPIGRPAAVETKTADNELPSLSGDNGPSFGNSAAPRSEPKFAPSQPRNEHRSKMELIAARRGQTGLKGFCPVMLRDHRELVDASDEFGAEFNNRRYYFSSEAALETFLNEPTKYAPAARGVDVIHMALTGEEVSGSLDHAVWYKGRLYLFSSVETMETFSAGPSSHATDE